MKRRASMRKAATLAMSRCGFHVQAEDYGRRDGEGAQRSRDRAKASVGFGRTSSGLERRRSGRGRQAKQHNERHCLLISGLLRLSLRAL